MNKLFIFLVFSFLYFPSVLAVEIPDDLIFESDKNKTLLDIDPSTHILGIKLGSSKEDIIKEFGKPTGIINLKGDSTMLIYGSRVGFFIEDNKMTGALIENHNLISWEISGRVKKHPSLSSFKWVLSNGIKEGMGLDKVKKIVGDKYKSERNYSGEFTLGKCKIKLTFSHYTNQGEKDSAYKVNSIHIFVQ